MLFPESLLDTVHIKLPGCEIIERGEEVLFINRSVGTRLTGNKRQLEMVEFFAQPRRLAELEFEGKADTRALALLIKNAIIADLGLAFSDASPAIGDACPAAEFITAARECDIAVFGTPTDSATSGGSDARTGPEKIRRAFRYPWRRPETEAQIQDHAGRKAETDFGLMLDIDMRRAYRTRPRVLDLGDLVCVTGESTASYGARIEWLVEQVLERGARPMILGGDHSITHYALEAFARKHKRFGVIHFDAHHDTYPSFFPGVTHGNFMLGAIKQSGLERVHQIGLRAPDWAPNAAAMIKDRRFSYVSARELQRMRPEDVFLGLPTDIPYYFTFDIDCMAPQVAPDTGTPVPGGMSYYQALDLVDYAANTFELGGFDIVEVGGLVQTTPSSGAADVAARLLFSLLLGHVPYETLETYLRSE